VHVEILGSGGAVTTPRPGCFCRICAQARQRGIPYSRAGPSLFVHGPNVLIDTPEEIKEQLNRSRVLEIDGCFYSHWHPDHVMGRRVWETRNKDWTGLPPQNRHTTIYLPEAVAADFRKHLGSWEHFEFMASIGVVRIVDLQDGEAVELSGVRVTPFRLAETYVYAFLLEDGNHRVLIAPDELYHWIPAENVKGVDLAVLPMGIVEFDPFTKERRISEGHPVLRSEATFEETLRIIEELKPRLVVLTHIEEPSGLSFDDLQRLERRLSRAELPIRFAFDTMIVRP
jgi:phosphoribosyl 1,2-cyclic phosphate phosphodiesterase